MILNKITEERKKQDQKWGIQNHSNLEWLAVLTEEIGEVSQEVLRTHFGDKDHDDLVYEIIQVAAVCVAWLECQERNNGLSNT